MNHASDNATVLHLFLFIAGKLKPGHSLCIAKYRYILLSHVLIIELQRKNMSPGLRELEAHLTKSFAGHRDPQIIPRWGIPQWMGGNEAIDFIYVYSINHPELGEYWHFITAGLSDLFGDGRVNFPIYEDHDLSGFGIELSIMVRKQSQHIPVWPPTILHKLARYIFESGNRILPGDNIPNNMPIENNSSLRHFLAVDDLFVKQMKSTIGEVSFVQLVGLADNEWNAANNWSGSQFSDLLIGEFFCWSFFKQDG